LQNAGYSQQQINSALNEFEDEERGLPPVSKGYFPLNQFPNENLIKWQLELEDILEKARHILREDVIIIENGNIIWKPHPNQEKRIFNDEGVNEFLRVLTMYVNRNTILSNYEPQEIKDKVYDFGKEVNDLIFMKYENLGMNTEEKRKNYPMLVREIIDIVHSAYKRAQWGMENESLRTARQITQSEQLSPMRMQENSPLKERNLLNPARYILGKYKK